LIVAKTAANLGWKFPRKKGGIASCDKSKFREKNRMVRHQKLLQKDSATGGKKMATRRTVRQKKPSIRPSGRGGTGPLHLDRQKWRFLTAQKKKKKKFLPGGLKTQKRHRLNVRGSLSEAQNGRPGTRTDPDKKKRESKTVQKRRGSERNSYQEAKGEKKR